MSEVIKQLIQDSRSKLSIDDFVLNLLDKPDEFIYFNMAEFDYFVKALKIEFIKVLVADLEVIVQQSNLTRPDSSGITLTEDKESNQ